MLRRWTVILTVSCLAIAVFMQLPQLIHMLDARYRGIPVILNSDEYVYLARVEEALTGRPGQAAEAFIGDPHILGAQPALIERIEGELFSFTGWRASTVLQIMDSVIPPLLFLVLWWFLRFCGFSRLEAFVGAGVFIVLELYNLNRPVNQRTSFLLTVLALLGIIAGLERRWYWGVLGGAITGMLLGVYFWSWTYAVPWLGLLFLWELMKWMRTQRNQTNQKIQRREMRESRWTRLLLFGVIALIAATPFALDLRHLMQSPFYQEAVFRSGIHPSRLPESWIYSMLFFSMTAGVLVGLLRRYEILQPYKYAIVTVVTAFVILNQQVIDGVVFMYASHYLFFLILGAIVALLLSYRFWKREKILALSGITALVYLIAIGYDGRFLITQMTPKAADFQEEHLATLLPILDAMPRARILTDPDTSLFIAGASKHDVVYALYLKNLLLSNEEIAQRYCSEQLPLDPKFRDISHQAWLIYPDADSAYANDPSVRAREVRMVEDACAALDKNPPAALRKFGVEYVLWDEEREPRWNLSRLKVSLKKAGSGEGWSLWKIGDK